MPIDETGNNQLRAVIDAQIDIMERLWPRFLSFTLHKGSAVEYTETGFMYGVDGVDGLEITVNVKIKKLIDDDNE